MINTQENVKIYNYKKNEKVREIVTYVDNYEGKKLKSEHELINRTLNELYPSNQNSYAYKKNNSTKIAFNSHLNSKLFMKLDIKSFF